MGGVIRISSGGDDRMGAKKKKKQSLDQNVTPKKSHAEFLTPAGCWENTRKLVNHEPSGQKHSRD